MISVKTKLLYDSQTSTVYYDADTFIGTVVWHMKPEFEEYKKPFQLLVDHANSGHPVRRFLTDARKKGVISPQMRKWFQKEMFPKAVAAGLERVAVVSDENLFTRYYLNAIIRGVNKFRIPFKIVSSEEKGLDFLLER